MRKTLSILLACGLASQAATISSAGLVADRDGTRLVFRTGEEVLSRSRVEPDGSLLVEIQGTKTALEGHLDLSTNAKFASVDASNLYRDGADVASFRFRFRSGVKASVLHREWNGQDLSFLLDKTPARAQVSPLWTMAPSHDASVVLAALTTTASLEGARAWGAGDLETVELRFSVPPIQADLQGAGKSYTIKLGKSRVAKLNVPASASRLIQAMVPGKDGEIKLTLKEDARSVLLTRSGNTVALRLVAKSPVQKAWAWNSLQGKVETFGGADMPSDESVNLANLRNDLKPQGGEGFTADGSKSSTESKGTLAGNSAASGDKAALGEAQKLEAERRKSREIAQEQLAQDAAKVDAEEKKNRVTYNTFGVRDPFIPLESDDLEGGLNVDQMRVVGIIASPTRPMAVLEHTSQPGLSVALREGDAIQNGRVLKIERDRVVFVLEEFGVSRQFALKLQAPKGEKS
jgi:hypothetical protein